jgi:phospholipid/cholesterol/gamma-HCH transport system substrate-binding protein
MRQAISEFFVGLLIIFAVISFLILAVRVSGLESYRDTNRYKITAEFSQIGDLKVRAPVTLAGVKIGNVSAIDLDPITLDATVTLSINRKYNQIPVDSAASIYTAGLLGSNYVAIIPGFSDHSLKDGDRLQNTTSALILQDLIGKFLFSSKNSEVKSK